MNTLYPYIEPVINLWNDLTTDKKFKEYTEFPIDWHTKWLAHERMKVNDVYRGLWKRFYEQPELTETLKDNAYRFTALAFVERWYNLRQAQGFLKARFQIPNSDVGALNALRGQGILGSFRGNLLNLFHFVGVHYHALLYSNNNPLQYLLFASLFEVALYPVDTLRTLLYADVNKQFKNTFDAVTQTVSKNGLGHFYRGVELKLAYNIFFGLNLWSVSNDSNLQYLTFPLWIASYGILALKTRLQIAGSPLSYHGPEDANTILNTVVRRESIRGLYAGLLPFLALNIFAAYHFPGIFSEEKKRNLLKAVRDTAPIENYEGKYW